MLFLILLLGIRCHLVKIQTGEVLVQIVQIMALQRHRVLPVYLIDQPKVYKVCADLYGQIAVRGGCVGKIDMRKVGIVGILPKFLLTIRIDEPLRLCKCFAFLRRRREHRSVLRSGDSHVRGDGKFFDPRPNFLWQTVLIKGHGSVSGDMSDGFVIPVLQFQTVPHRHAIPQVPKAQIIAGRFFPYRCRRNAFQRRRRFLQPFHARRFRSILYNIRKRIILRVFRQHLVKLGALHLFVDEWECGVIQPHRLFIKGD